MKKILGLLLLSAWGLAQAQLSPQAQEALKKYVINHPSTQGLRTEIEWTDVRARNTNCNTTPDVSLVGRNRPWGRINLLLRCSNPIWTVNVPTQVKVYGQYVVATHFISQGLKLNASDVRPAEGDLSALPENIARNVNDVVDRQTTRAISAGAHLELNNLREPTVVKAGDQVRVQLVGRGFQAIGEAVAMSAGQIGDNVKIRMPDGQQMQAQVIKAGLVELRLD